MNRIRERASDLRSEPIIAEYLSILRDEMRFLARCARKARLVSTWAEYGLSSNKYLPLSLSPVLDPALVRAGIAIGWHTAPPFVDPPSIKRPGNRLLMGHLVYSAKSYNQQQLIVEDNQIYWFGALALCALAPTAFAQSLELIVSMPSSRESNTLPHRIAEEIAKQSQIPLASGSSIRFQRPTEQSKETHDYWAKRKLIDGSMIADPMTMAGKSVIIVDDICKYGATFIEAARACREAGARSVSVLALSKTFTCQKIPEKRAPQIDRYHHRTDTRRANGPRRVVDEIDFTDPFNDASEYNDEVPIP